jgi:hypothetical protein
LSSFRLQPDTWDMLKAGMHERFVPPAYQCNLHKKITKLGPRRFVPPAYQRRIHAGVHEETEDKICHFYSGLRTKI